MAFTRPAKSQDISAEDFGQPVYDGVIRAGASRSGVQASFPNNAYTGVTWVSNDADTGGFIQNAQNVIVPADKAGVYSVSYLVTTATGNGASYMSIYASGNRYDFNGTGSGAFAGTIIQPLPVGAAVYLMMWNGSGAALTPTSSRLYVYRVSL